MGTRPIAPEVWERLPPEVQAYILVLEHSLRQALAKIDQLEQKVNELEAKINRNSNNSSLPPSQNPPSAPNRLVKKKSGKKPGGQSGHQGNHREMLPSHEVDDIVEHRAQCCPLCQGQLL